MMLRYLGWDEAADLIMKGVANTIAAKELTFDLALIRRSMRSPVAGKASGETVQERMQQLIPGATLVGTRAFGAAVIRHMDD